MAISYYDNKKPNNWTKSYGEEEGKDQESIQSTTTPDPGHHMGM